ncbi:MAG: EF-hand domain-containing protein [archaeon]|nr:EF-hand domain-containing protein [archaeon]
MTNEKAAQLKNCSDFFQAFDDDGNGVLDRGEFTKCHESLVNCGITTETFERLLANIDKDGDGHISFNEYITWLIDQNKLHLAPSTAYLIPHADDTTAGAAEAAPTVSVGPTPAAADVASTPEVSAPASPTPSAPAAEAPSAVSAFRQKSEFFAQQAAAAAEELRLRRLRRANAAH